MKTLVHQSTRDKNKLMEETFSLMKHPHQFSIFLLKNVLMGLQKNFQKANSQSETRKMDYFYPLLMEHWHLLKLKIQTLTGSW